MLKAIHGQEDRPAAREKAAAGESGVETGTQLVLVGCVTAN